MTAAVILGFAFPGATPARRRRLVRWWSTKLVRILGLALRVEGARPAAHAGATMIAANHVSWVDIFLVSSVRPTRFIAKREIRAWPFVGWIAERAGTLFVRRDRRHDTGRINVLVHDALAQGDCVGLFPEGTTTEGDRLLKFHTSLFEPAIANAARIHPCAIRYERPDGSLCRELAYAGDMSFLQSVTLALRQRGVLARIAFADPIEPGPQLDRREAARLARERIATLLRLPPSDS